MMVGGEVLKSFFSFNIQYNNHVSTNQETSIGNFLWLVAAIVEYFEFRVLIIL